MTKITLEFDYHEDSTDFELAHRGSDFHHALWELDMYLRARLKYEELTDDVDTALQAARDKLHELIQDAGGFV